MNIRILILKAVINLEKHRIREGRCANCTIPNLHPSSPDASLIFILELLIEALGDVVIGGGFFLPLIEGWLSCFITRIPTNFYCLNFPFVVIVGTG